MRHYRTALVRLERDTVYIFPTYADVMSAAPSTDTPVVCESLPSALREILVHPWANLVGLWNWKSAAISALIRASTFLFSNLRSGSHKAVRAMLVEATFAIFAAGVMGAITQRLRSTQPRWATALVLALGMPACMVAIQSELHHAAGTPHLRIGLIVSFYFAALASSFTWFTMQRGVLLAGKENAGLLTDMRALPGVILDFLLVGPRALLRLTRQS